MHSRLIACSMDIIDEVMFIELLSRVDNTYMFNELGYRVECITRPSDCDIIDWHFMAAETRFWAVISAGLKPNPTHPR
jgi:hypothetical protein